MAGYVNPFGGYATGYHQGVGEEEGVQQGARQAREEDFQNRYLDPARAHEAARSDVYGAARQPYDIAALPDAAAMLHDRAGMSRLGFGSELAQDTGQTGMLDDAAHLYAPNAENYWNPGQLQQGADFPRAMVREQTQVRGQIAEADVVKAQAMQDWYARRYGGGPGGARGAAAPGASFDPMGRIAPPGAAEPVPLTPSAPTAPAAAPASRGYTDPAGGVVSPQGDYTPPAGTNPQASIPAFHQMHPIHQGYVIHGVSQALGIPPEEALAHIQRQQQPSAPAGVDASKYYA